MDAHPLPAHWHALFWQVDGATHVVPQAPQLVLLVVVSTQLPSQFVNGATQAHSLSTHVRLVPQDCAQKPQWALLLVRSTQLGVQSVSPDRH
jgi:hypothetical protein